VFELPEQASGEVEVVESNQPAQVTFSLDASEMSDAGNLDVNSWFNFFCSAFLIIRRATTHFGDGGHTYV
jgi:hypothetical protein